MQQPFDLSGQWSPSPALHRALATTSQVYWQMQEQKVVLGARRTEKLKARVEDITTSGGEAIAKTLDVRDKGSIAGFLDSVYEQYAAAQTV